ncbi:MAG: hypothetical protein K1X39_08565 [Thermoflexales bacterium]|nr:hypothetical protein [Thermoflexales bacterium]
MSVLHCNIPDFVSGLLRRGDDALREGALGVLAADGTLWEASAEARACGVLAGMTTRQARMRCPDLRLREIDPARVAAEQAAFAGVLAQTGLDVEMLVEGAGFVDLSPVTRGIEDVRPLCADLGRAVRAELGEALQPALGWDSGKFTAQAAALSVSPGHMRLVPAVEEARFLGPLPASLLPLPPLALMQLRWLGIRTLGDFARLPVAATLQRFGPAGKLALELARGHDPRPVRPGPRAVPEPVEVELDAPTEQPGLALEALLRALAPLLAELEARLEGVRGLRLEGRMLEGTRPQLSCTFVTPLSDAGALREALSAALAGAAWPGALLGLRASALQIGERYPVQLSLLMDGADSRPALREAVRPGEALVRRLLGRHGAIFYAAELPDPTHPALERRGALRTLAEAR